MPKLDPSPPVPSIVRRAVHALFPRLRESNGETDLSQLTRLVRRYSVEQQQVPKALAEVVALEYLETIPLAPKGKKFVIDRSRVEVRLESA